MTAYQQLRPQASKPGLLKLGPFKLGPFKLGPFKLGPFKLGPFKAGPFEAGSVGRLAAMAGCLAVLLAGCPKPAQPPAPGRNGLPLAGIKLRLAVVADPQLALAAGRVQGEWNALTGSEFQVETMTEEELLAADPIAADAVICASHRLGDLAQRQRIVPVPEGLREDAAWGDLFELPQLREASWADRTLAVPFGSPVLTCYYRADLLEKLGQKPPQTWSEYQKLAALLVDPAGSGDPSAEAAARSGTIEPLGPGWAGIVLLARAASYAKHRNNYSALFDIRTMEPLVAGPPFIRALEELVAAAEVGAADQLQYDPSAVRAAFWQGRGGMALTWPTRAAEKLPENVPAEIRVGFVELPGSQQAFDVGDQKWDARGEGDETHVPLLAIAGRIGVVSAGSTQPDAAFQLLLWLSGDPTGSKVCGASGATTLFRHSQLKSPQAWVETPVLPSSAAQYAEVTAKTFRRQQWMAALRIPGRAEYLAALDEAVHQAVRDRRPAAEVLQEAVVRWKEITGRLGVEGQKAAYRHGLGLD